MKPFVIVGMPRTGSTLLLRALQQHPDIQAYGELFHWLEAERAAAYHAIHSKSATISFDAKTGNALEFLREWVWGQANAHFKAVGFKIFAEHAVESSSPDFFRSLLQEIPGLHVIHVQRPNYLDVFVSWLIAQQTGEWFISSDSVSVKGGHQTISPAPDQASAFFAKMESADRFFGDTFSGGSYLPVFYEDLSRNLQETCDRIFQFLGVGASPVTPLIRKQIERDIPEIVSNYRQLSEHFSGSKYAKFFHALRPVHSEWSWPNNAMPGYSVNYRILPYAIKK
jgi:LPS sulfotransferase NodH